MIQVTVPIYYTVSKGEIVLAGLNWYRNVHYAVNNKIKKFVCGIVLENVDGEPMLGVKIHVHFKIFFKRRGSDGGNVRSVIEKYVLDAIKKAELIVDDNFEVIVSDSSEYFHDKTHPRAEIILMKMEDRKFIFQ
jgi:hypothetical protein